MAQNKLCLLIDDDEDDREVFAWAMRDARVACSLVTAENGLAAIRKLESDTSLAPDYIFLDLNMPMMDGKETLKAIKEIDRLREVPVYVYSTSSQPQDKTETAAMGAVDFIVKPSSVTQLVNILSAIIT